MNYLAIVANAYNPTLLVFSIGISVYLGFKYKSGWGILFILSAFIVYSMMFVDKWYSIWASVGCDFSTHTATSLAMCLYIGISLRRRSINFLLAGTIIAYFEIMVILGYHNWADIISTAIPVGLILGALYYFMMNHLLFTQFRNKE